MGTEKISVAQPGWARMRGLATLAVLIALVLVPGRTSAAESVWTAETGVIVYAVASSDDGSLVVAGRRDNLVSAYDGAGGHLWDYPTQGTVYGVAVTGDGSRIVAASEDRHVYLLDRSGQELWRHEGTATFSSVAISRDGAVIVTGSDDRHVWVFDQSGALHWQFAVLDRVESVAVYGSERGFRVIVGSNDSRVTLLSGEGEPLWQQTLDHAITGLDAVSNGAQIVAGDNAGVVTLLDGRTGEPIWSKETGSEVDVTISEEGSFVVAGNRSGEVVVFDAEGDVIQQQSAGSDVYAVARPSDQGSAIFGMDGRVMAASQGSDGRIEIEQPSSRVIPIAAAAAAAIAVVLVLLGLRRGASGERVWRGFAERQQRLGARIWRARISYLFLLPTVTLLLIFNYYPAFSGIYHAFTVWTPGGETRWVGLQQFRSLVDNQYFGAGIRNLVILVLTGFLKLAVPLLVAELIFHLWSHRLRYLMRTLFVLQIIVPGVVGILLWVNIYDPTIGMANQVLRAVGLDGWTRSWLGDSDTALGSIVFMGFPWVSAFALLIFYGGLISIPGELFDAAEVDGASALRRFFNIDLPLLLSQVRLLLILTFIAVVQEFAAIFLTTGGGPGSATYVPSLELYYQAMRFNNFGYASAIGAVLFLVILGGTILNLRYVKSSVEYGT